MVAVDAPEEFLQLHGVVAGIGDGALRRAYELKGTAMPGVQFLLGEVYYQKKDYAKAIEAFETYLRVLPDAPNAAQVREAIDRLRKALKK